MLSFPVSLSHGALWGWFVWKRFIKSRLVFGFNFFFLFLWCIYIYIHTICRIFFLISKLGRSQKCESSGRLFFEAQNLIRPIQRLWEDGEKVYIWVILVCMSLHKEREAAIWILFFSFSFFFLWRKRREMGGLMIPQMDSLIGYKRIFQASRFILDMEELE